MEEFKKMVIVDHSTQCFKVLNNKHCMCLLLVIVVIYICKLKNMHLTKNAQKFLKCLFKCNRFVM